MSTENIAKIFLFREIINRFEIEYAVLPHITHFLQEKALSFCIAEIQNWNHCY